MANAEELMRIMIQQPNPEGHVIIGGDRFITVPDNLKRIGVQFDHNVETVTFDCPKQWDDTNLSTLVLCVNYTLPDGTPDCFPVKNLRIDEDDDSIIHFDWEISENVTRLKGPIQFAVCGVDTAPEIDEDTGEPVEKLVVRWNTEINRDMYISEGMECPQSQIVEEYEPDLVTQLLKRYMSVEQITEFKNAAQTAASNAKDDADRTAEIANEVEQNRDEIRNSYAPAIKGNVSGEIIRVDDVSPLEHDVTCRVHGKNLFDVSRIPEGVGAADNCVSAVGVNFLEITCVDPYNGNGHLSTGVKLKDLCPQMRPGKKYILSATTDAFNKCMYLNQLDYFWQFNTAITVTEEMLECGTGFYGYAPYRGQEHGSCRIYDIQIEEGSVITAYEPYIDPTNVTVMARSKNVLELSGNLTHNGVTKTVDVNGLVTVKGTSTSSININVGSGFMKAGCKYRPLIQKVQSDVAPSFWNFEKEENMNKDKDGYISSDVDTEFSAFIYTASAGTVYDSAFRVMVELVTDDMTDEYESYKGSEAIVTSSDGTCTVTSKSPTMTLFTDTPGVTIESEYNRDTTKMFESYVLTPEAKSQIAAEVEDDMAEILASLNSYATSLIGGGV